MAGTRQGGLKAVQTTKQRYGDDFYKNIGRKGGKAHNRGGFFNDPQRASLAGKIGGLKSRRNGSIITPIKEAEIEQAKSEFARVKNEIKQTN